MSAFPDTYPIPKKQLVGNPAELAINEVIFRYMAYPGRDNCYEDREACRLNGWTLTRLADCSGVDAETVSGYLHTKRDWLECQRPEPREFDLVIHQYKEKVSGQGVHHKPVAYVDNGWLRAVYQFKRKSYFWQRALTLLLAHHQPKPEANLLNELSKRIPEGYRERSLSRSETQDVIDSLCEWGVLSQVASPPGALCINRERFNDKVDKLTFMRRWSLEELKKHPDFGSLKDKNPELADSAVNVCRAGRFEPDELPAIFDCLRRRTSDVERIIQDASRRRKDETIPWHHWWSNWLARLGKEKRQQRAGWQSSMHTRGQFDAETNLTGFVGLPNYTSKDVQDVVFKARLWGQGPARVPAERTPVVQVVVTPREGHNLGMELQFGKIQGLTLPLKLLRERTDILVKFTAQAAEPRPGLTLEVWLEAHIT